MTRKKWTKADIEELHKLVFVENSAWSDIAKILDRSIQSCQNKALKQGTKRKIHLNPNPPVLVDKFPNEAFKNVLPELPKKRKINRPSWKSKYMELKAQVKVKSPTPKPWYKRLFGG